MQVSLRNGFTSGPGGTSAFPGLPFLESCETVPNDDHLGKGIYGPVPPQKVVVERRPTVEHVKDGGLAVHTPFSFLGYNVHRCKHTSYNKVRERDGQSDNEL